MYLHGEDFKKLKISDEKYFSPSMGNIFEDQIRTPFDLNKELVVSNSLLGQVFNRGLFNVLHGKDLMKKSEGISEDLKDIFILGSAFHCYVLEHDEFYSRYYVSDYSDKNKDAIGFSHVSKTDFEFIKECFIEIKKMYPSVVTSKYNEITITGILDGVPVKAKIDCLIANNPKSDKVLEIIDLKGVYYKFFDQRAKKTLSSGDRVGLRSSITALNYDLQGFFYTELISHAYGINRDDIAFNLLLCSKDDYSVQLFRLNTDKILKSGEEKFNFIWDDVKDFVLNGKDVVKNYIEV